jgi:hypothetical protein
LSARTLSYGTHDQLAEAILALDSEIRYCFIVSDPQGSFLSITSKPEEKKAVSKIIDSASIMIANSILFTLKSQERIDQISSETEYILIQRKLQTAILFRSNFNSLSIVLALGLTKKSEVRETYEKVISFLKAT